MFWKLVFLTLISFELREAGSASTFEATDAVKLGASFCNFLVNLGIVPRWVRAHCGKPKCGWDHWQHATNHSFGSSANDRIVLSYGHNGFGNQLWSHTFAFMVAEALNAKLLISVVPAKHVWGYYPPHTWEGDKAMRAILPDEFEYRLLDKNSTERQLCEAEPFVLSDRPRDKRDKAYMGSFKSNLLSILHDPKPRCLKFIGYFQDSALCKDDVRRLWTSRLFHTFPDSPGPNDISLYLRCLPSHYFFNSLTYYQAILNNTQHEKIWMFMSPDCPKKVAKSGGNAVHQVIRYLTSIGAQRWPQLPPFSFKDMHTAQLLADVAALAQSSKLVLPESSWAFWSGVLSNAQEVHVNAPRRHRLMPDMPQYIYHQQENNMYYGHYDREKKKIIYDIDLSKRKKMSQK
jgi:hypothetical protein